MRVVVCGAGVIGAAVAYYLSRRGAAVVLLEREAVACAASGKSGGFLAADWCQGQAQDGLARTLYPAHTMSDGDTVFSLATGTWTDAPDVTLIGALAADVMAEAILRAVRLAEGVPGIPSVSELGR